MTMCRENAKRFAEVLLAYSRGEPLQVRTPAGRWVPVLGDLNFDSKPEHYRIAPKKTCCRVWLFDGPTRHPCVIASDSPMDWDAFAKFTPNFGGWLTEPLEYGP